MVINLINSSRFQVAEVEAILTGDGRRVVVCGGRQSPIVVLQPQQTETRTISPGVNNVGWHLEIAFNDDNGERWHKYGPKKLHKVPGDFSLVD